MTEKIEIRSVALTSLLVLAGGFTLYLARPFLFPIVLAILLNFLLSPVIRMLGRFRIAEPVGAALVVLVLVGGLGASLYGLTDPVREWAAKAPESLASLQNKLRPFRKPVEQVTRTAEQVERATTVTSTPSRTPEVVLRRPRLSDQLFGTTWALAVGFVEVVILLYFLLAGGELFLQKLVRVLPQLTDKKMAVSIVRQVETSISTYLVTVTGIYILQGAATAGILWAIRMPGPLLWGTLVVLCEFVPYVGPFVLAGVLAAAAISVFDSLPHALLAPGFYIAISFLQGNFLTPALLGRRLTLNPVAIVIGLMFWWLVWGVPGAFIAVPMLATFKIICDHIESLQPIGEFLGK